MSPQVPGESSRREHFDDGAISDRPEAVIFDMDGTLANVESIRHHVEGPKRDFHAFHTESVNVPPNPDVLEMAQQADAEGKKVVIVTSRTTKYRHHTAYWLADNKVPSDAMYMRAHGDQRPDREVKEGLYRRLSRSYDVVHAVDDNPSILELWEEKGIPTTKVESSIGNDPRYQRRGRRRR